ncbi:MAG: hypothetical protein HW374_1176 [Bacteroidetes bacterium]|nr:hypothetical protein [Bacteroidota bacterium]
MLKTVKSLLSAAAIYGLGTVASKFIGLFLLPFFTRALSPSEYGVFETLSVLLFLLTTIGTLGLDSAMLRFYYESNDSNYRRSVVSSAFWLATTAGIALTVAGIALSGPLNDILFRGVLEVSLLQVTMLTVAVSIPNTIQLALFQTKREPGKYSWLTLLRFSVMYGVSIWLLLRGDGVMGIMVAQWIAYACSLVLGFVFSRRDLVVGVSGQLTKPMMIFSAPLIVGSVSAWLLSSSDRFFLVRLSTLEELGLYSLGSRFASIIQLAVLAFQMAWPQFVLSNARETGSEQTQARILTYYLFVGIVLVLVVSLFAPELLFVFATERYSAASAVVLLLCCSSLFYGCYFVFGIVLSVTKRTLSILPVMLPPLVVNIALNTYLVPALGGKGSAIASTSAYFFMAALAFFFTHRLMPIPYEWRRISKLIAAATIVLLVPEFVTFEAFASAILFKCALLAAFLGLLFALRFFLDIELVTLRRLLGMSESIKNPI